MLPNIDLDEESYEEIIEEARNKIVSIYPQWTDFNYHDPGITMIEMFSWIKEAQEYYLNQIGDEAKNRYLKLLGVKRSHKKPANAMINIESVEDSMVLPNTKFYAGNVCFENTKQKYLVKNDILKCLCTDINNQVVEIIDRKQLSFSSKLRVFAFGKEAKKGNAIYIEFESALPRNIELSLYISIFNNYDVKRNPIYDDSFVNLANLKFEYSTASGFQSLELIKDETYSFLQSGFISFMLNDDMELNTIGEDKGFFIKITLEDSQYDIPPVIEEININCLKLRQTDTIFSCVDIEEFDKEDESYSFYTDYNSGLYGGGRICCKSSSRYYFIPVFETFLDEDIVRTLYRFNWSGPLDSIMIINNRSEYNGQSNLGIGTGLPYQEIDLCDYCVDYDTFEIMIEDIDEQGGYSKWAKVDDFGNSGPEDKQYVFDSLNGIIKFGDCEHGMAPEGNIEIVSYVKTLGYDGNVSANKINSMENTSIESIKITNPSSAEGGSDEETLNQSFIRCRKELKRSDTAITYNDYERYINETPGLMIDSCKVINRVNQDIMYGSFEDELKTYIVVRPFSYNNEENVSERYIINILNHIEQYRMIGSSVEILSPQYIKVDIYIDVKIRPYFIDAKERIVEKITQHFSDLHDKFGSEIVFSELYGVIDILECVKNINSLNIDARGRGVTKNQDGNITLPPNGVALLGNIEYTYNIES